MLKSTAISLLFILVLSNSKSQITLDSSDFPVPGLVLNRYNGWQWGFAGVAGPAETYDFSNVNFPSGDTLNFENALATPFAAQHPGAEIALRQEGGQTWITYYGSDSSAFWQSGVTVIGDFGNGWDTIYGNNPVGATDTVTSNQFVYGYTDWEYSVIPIYDVVPTIDVHLHRIRFIDVNGWGMLITPFDTFPDVLRIWRTEYQYDSTFVNNVFASASSNIAYSVWFYAKNVGYPVVVANTNAGGWINDLQIIDIPTMIYGCTDPNAANYNPLANVNDSSCYYCSPVPYTVTPDTGICYGDSVTLTVSGGSNWIWSTGATIPTITVSPDSDMVYSVFVSDTIACWEQSAIHVEVYKDVTAGFWVNPINLYTLDSIPFINTSLESNTWLWDFDDPVDGNSSLENPLHQYSSQGTKDVMLVASNPCSADTFFSILNIIVLTTGLTEFISSLAIYPNPSNEDAIISFRLNTAQQIEATAIDLFGRRYPLLDKTMLLEGNYKYGIASRVKGLPTGIYFIELKAGENTRTQKWIKLR